MKLEQLADEEREYRVQGSEGPKEGDDTIAMPHGDPPRYLRDIRPGSWVLGYNRTANRTEPDGVVEVYRPSRWEYYLKINGSRELLPIHQVLVRQHENDERGTWTDVDDLEIGHELRLGNMAWERIVRLEQVGEITKAYGFGVNPCEGYVSNGVVVCVKQEFREPLP